MRLSVILSLAAMASAAPDQEPKPFVPLYQTLPPTPNLPSARFHGTAPVNGIKLWYAQYGPPARDKVPVVFLHGGKISSRWWANQVEYLAEKGYPVIAIDTRGHGRSTDDLSVPLTYDLFASDVAALLQSLKIPRASIAGWSDGGNTILSLLMHHTSLVDRAFIFGANYRPDQLNVTGLTGIPFLADLASRMASEYAALSPTPKGFDTFKQRMDTMQASLPMLGASDFSKIPTRFADPKGAPIVWIADGDSEEIVQRQVAGEMRDMVWGSSLVLMPEVGHFAPLQDPDTVSVLLERWAAKKR